MCSSDLRNDLGATFAKVVTTDHWLYSTGIIMGIRGFFGRSFYKVEEDNNGYAMRLFVPQNLTASDLACAMIKKADFEAVGGMAEDMSYICSAVDLYLKLGKQEKIHLFETRAKAIIDAEVNDKNQWIDFGGITEDEITKFCQIWPEATQNVDRNYNVNFNQRFGGYQIKPAGDFIDV